jgi:hypothetical protein
MGCSPIRIAQERKGQIFDANSEKLPKTVLEGFDKILKSAITPVSTILKPKSLQTKPKVIEVNPKPEEDTTEKQESQPEAEIDSKDLIETRREDPPKVEPNPEVDLKEQIENEDIARHGSSENSPRSQSELRQNTEKPVFQNMSSVLIVDGFD